MIEMRNYGGGSSAPSMKKAMKVDIGEYTLYFSYNTLIAFENKEKVYVTTKFHSHTTSRHESSVGWRDKVWRDSPYKVWRDREYVPDKLLQIIAYSNILKLPFKEILKLVDLQD